MATFDFSVRYLFEITPPTETAFITRHRRKAVTISLPVYTTTVRAISGTAKRLGSRVPC